MKIPPIAVAVIGVVLCLLAGGLIGWFVVKQTQDEISAAQTRVDAAAADATPAAHQQAAKAVADAKVQVQQIQTQWAVKQAALMPAFDVTQRFQAWRQLNYELTEDLPLSLQKWFPQTGVSLLSNIQLPAPPASPNDPLISTSPIVIKLGTIAVGGDFHKILSHILKWNDYKRLVLVDNLALQGNSPFMQGSYTAELIIYPQGDKAAADIPQASTGTGGAGGFPGGPGGFGGYPGGGFPGGPGGPRGAPPMGGAGKMGAGG